MDFLIRLFTKIFFRINVINKENFPMDDNGLIICANHISAWDPILLWLYLPKEASYLAKKELYNNYFIRRFLEKHNAIPIDRDKPELSSLRTSISILKKGRLVGIFPQGTRLDTISEDQAKSGIAMMAYTAEVPVLPIYIDGSMKLFSRVNIIVGKPIEPIDDEDISKKEKYDKFSRLIMRKIMELKDGSICS